ncbi:MAG: YchJ family protein [Rhodothermaceae bacterium]
MTECPCGSRIDFEECCEKIFMGDAKAATAEALMRSRYTAYVEHNYRYLLESLHPDHRKDYDEEATKQWAESSEWTGLEIVSTEKGQENDTTGEVEFIANFRIKEHDLTHHEVAKFEKIDGDWYFVEGEDVKPAPVINDEPKVGRNEPCPCGSGKKFKKCCG